MTDDISMQCGFLTPHGFYANISAIFSKGARTAGPDWALLYFNAIPLGQFPVRSMRVHGGLCYAYAPKAIGKALRNFSPCSFYDFSSFVFKSLQELMAKKSLSPRILMDFEGEALTTLCEIFSARTTPSTVKMRLLDCVIKAIQSTTHKKDGTITLDGKRKAYSEILEYMIGDATATDVLLWSDKALPEAYAQIVENAGEQHLTIKERFLSPCNSEERLVAAARRRIAQGKALRCLLKEAAPEILPLTLYRKFASHSLVNMKSARTSTLTVDDAIALLLAHLKALRAKAQDQGCWISCF